MNIYGSVPCTMLAVEIQPHHMSPTCKDSSLPGILTWGAETAAWPLQEWQHWAQVAFSFGGGSWLIPTQVSHRVSYWDLGDSRPVSHFLCPTPSTHHLQGLREARRKACQGSKDTNSQL